MSYAKLFGLIEAIAAHFYRLEAGCVWKTFFRLRPSAEVHFLISEQDCSRLISFDTGTSTPDSCCPLTIYQYTREIAWLRKYEEELS